MPTTPPPADVLEQLEEKDQLIQALTERLSEVAEQLDRAQRSGSDRGGRSGGPPGELAEQQRQLLEGLSAAVELWDGLQPRDAFHRIEARLDHLRTLLESTLGGDVAPSELPPIKGQTSRPVPSPAPLREESKRAEPKPETTSTPQTLSGWEAMKAQLLGGTLAATPSAPQAPAVREQTPAAPSPAETPAVRPTADAAVRLGDDVTLPEPVDFDSADRDALEQAIEVRDHFIGILTRKLRNEQHRTRQAIDWAALNNAPEEQLTKLQSLEAELEDRHRIAEVELSLERARLSRVESRIEDMQRQVEMRLKNAWPQGQPGGGSGSKAAQPNDDASSKSWLNALRRR